MFSKTYYNLLPSHEAAPHWTPPAQTMNLNRRQYLASLHYKSKIERRKIEKWKHYSRFYIYSLSLHNLSSSASKLAHFNIFSNPDQLIYKKCSKKKLMILTVKLGLTSQFLARVNIVVVSIFMKNILHLYHLFVYSLKSDFRFKIDTVRMINLLSIVH